MSDVHKSYVFDFLFGINFLQFFSLFFLVIFPRADTFATQKPPSLTLNIYIYEKSSEMFFFRFSISLCFCSAHNRYGMNIIHV